MSNKIYKNYIKKKNVVCKDCKMRKTIFFNLLKKVKIRPRIFIVECGLCPGKEHKSNCQYFKPKTFLQKLLYFL